jgi:DNA-binding NarL/FixJ family response regulator
MAARLLDEFGRHARQSGAPHAVAGGLSPREQEVLRQLAVGASNKEIAASLGIAENTVKNHLKNILEKLHLENRVQAATFAVRAGLVDRTPGDAA